MSKNDKKLKLCWKFEKKLFLGCFSEKRVLPQKAALETLSPVLTTLLTIFGQKSVFSKDFKKNLSPTPPPVLKNVSKLNSFPGKNFFSEKFIWTDKDTILTICFQSSENICPMSRKSLEKIDLTKKNRLHWQISPDLCNPVLTILLKLFNDSTIFSLIFTKTNRSISEKVIQLLIIFKAKKVSMKKLLQTYKTHFWQSVEVLLSKYEKFLLTFW